MKKTYKIIKEDFACYRLEWEDGTYSYHSSEKGAMAMASLINKQNKEVMKIDELNKILKNPRGKLIAVDLDGTLCRGEFWGDKEPEPIQDRIEWLWEKIYKRGGHVIIWTARDPRWYMETRAWLIKHNVPYHGITMQKKIGADIYIDDKAINVNEIEFV